VFQPQLGLRSIHPRWTKPQDAPYKTSQGQGQLLLKRTPASLLPSSIVDVLIRQQIGSIEARGRPKHSIGRKPDEVPDLRNVCTGQKEGSSLLLAHIVYRDAAGSCHGHYVYNIQTIGTMQRTASDRSLRRKVEERSSEPYHEPRAALTPPPRHAIPM
jgi:hypothetical protein